MAPRRVAILALSILVCIVVGFRAGTRAQSGLMALPLVATAPADNPTTAEKVALGRLLFWDPVLSGPRNIACGTCHVPDAAYAEPKDLSNGVQLVKRNSQAVLNSAFNGIDVVGHYRPADAPMFWDTRVLSLERQALEPIKALEEMRGDTYSAEGALDAVVARLNAIPDYRARFSRAFGGAEAVTAINLGRAIAAFERSLVAVNSPFDRYMRGDTAAMTPLQVQGMERFTRSGCANCHSGPMFTDFKPHVIGVPDNPKLPATDSGISGRYAFRTASLRNLTLTAPYMHNGVLASLNDVVRFYDDVRRGGGRGGRGGRNGNATRNRNVSASDLDPFVQRLNVGRGGRDLVAFLEALTDTSFDRTIPASVPSGLPVPRPGN
jgi:cytochrome c peroxidase